MPLVGPVDVILPRTILVEVVGENRVEIDVLLGGGTAGSGNAGFTAVCGPIALSGGMLVTTNNFGLLVQADPTNPAHNGQAIGMLSGAIVPGESAFVTVSGSVDQPWSFVPGEQLFLGSSGQPVLYANLPPGIVFVLNIGSAVLPYRIELNIAPLPFTVT